MLIFIQKILPFVYHYRYLALFFLSLSEFRVTSIFSGFLISIGHLAFLPVYLLIVLSNVVPDIAYYYLGKFGSNLKFVKAREKNISTLKKLFHTHPNKIIVFGKLTVFVAVPMVITAGLVNYPIKKFLSRSLPTDLVSVLLLILLGYFSGHFYKNSPTYIEYIGLGLIIIYFSLFFIQKYIKSFILNKKLNSK